MTDSSMYNFDELEQQLGALARSMSEDDWRREAPPADLFPAILADIRSGGATAAPTQAPAPEYNDPGQPQGYGAQALPPQQPQVAHPQWAGEPQPHHGRPPEPPRPEAVPTTPPPANHQADVAHLGDYRDRSQTVPQTKSSRSGWLLAAAAAVAVLAVGGAALSGVFSSDGTPGETVASTTIVNDELPVTFDQNGTVVLRNDNGDLVLDVDVPSLPDSGEAFYEVWMIDTNVEGMISLGVLTADGVIDVPDSVDPAAFPVVDISVEPLDGDPTHSGQSILRGVLDVQ